MLAAVGRRVLLPLPPRFFIAAFSTTTTTTTTDPTASYLISTCGLSPTDAARAAPSLRLATPASTVQADAVLALLRRYGFSDADVSATVRKFPFVLSCDPIKTLQPKFDFLASVGITAPLLPRLISLSPILLHRSVQDHLSPLFDSLREVLGSDSRVVAALRKMPFVLRCQHKATLSPALSALRDVHGISPADVSKLVALHPGVILQGSDRIDEIVKAVKNAGVEPGDSMFIHVFAVLSKMKTPTLERKVAVYESLGFDKDDIILMLRRYPTSMSISEEKIKKTVKFLIDKVRLRQEDIVTYPTILVRSLESLTKRCAVLAVLKREGKREGQHRVPLALVSPMKRFLQVYVRRNQKEVPDVVLAINGKIPFKGFNADGLESGVR